MNKPTSGLIYLGLSTKRRPTERKQKLSFKVVQLQMPVLAMCHRCTFVLRPMWAHWPQAQRLHCLHLNFKPHHVGFEVPDVTKHARRLVNIFVELCTCISCHHSSSFLSHTSHIWFGFRKQSLGFCRHFCLFFLSLPCLGLRCLLLYCLYSQ